MEWADGDVVLSPPDLATIHSSSRFNSPLKKRCHLVELLLLQSDATLKLHLFFDF